jgi:hypothetical protein
VIREDNARGLFICAERPVGSLVLSGISFACITTPFGTCVHLWSGWEYWFAPLLSADVIVERLFEKLPKGITPVKISEQILSELNGLPAVCEDYRLGASSPPPSSFRGAIAARLTQMSTINGCQLEIHDASTEWSFQYINCDGFAAVGLVAGETPEEKLAIWCIGTHEPEIAAATFRVFERHLGLEVIVES